MSDTATCSFLHPFFVASELPDLDDAFEDGKQRAIRSLEARIDRVRITTRADYNKAFGIEPDKVTP
ncbi:MAG TPA: hypothetical protein VGU03_11130 [Frateuria sp.]|uniref:hypothetical protein n=1 Tax=Frateuria sp. TaxID=2211372 RepID=UPI002DF44667|nr:hypothetical protein [Frateuria sp.]